MGEREMTTQKRKPFGNVAKRIEEIRNKLGGSYYLSHGMNDIDFLLKYAEKARALLEAYTVFPSEKIDQELDEAIK